MNKTIPKIVAAMLAVSLAHPAAADEITDELDAARSAYDSGELRKAIQSLQVAVASIQEKINADLLKLLPKPLAGWQAEVARLESQAKEVRDLDKKRADLKAKAVEASEL